MHTTTPFSVPFESLLSTKFGQTPLDQLGAKSPSGGENQAQATAISDEWKQQGDVECQSTAIALSPTASPTNNVWHEANMATKAPFIQLIDASGIRRLLLFSKLLHNHSL